MFKGKKIKTDSSMAENIAEYDADADKDDRGYYIGLGRTVNCPHKT
jgi:hypothetical protein